MSPHPPHRRDGWRGAVATALAGLLALPTLAGAAAPAGDAQRGAGIYLHGLHADGRPVEAQRPGTGRLPPAAAACVGCHRASGRGGAEGGLRVPPIDGATLYTQGRPPSTDPRLQRVWLRHQTRPAYDDASLARALATGVDPAGQAMGPLMPRYRLDEQSQADLAAYLRQLGRGPIPGFDGRTLHLATVLAPDAPPQRRALVADVMRRWSSGLAFGALQVRWQAWELAGAPDTWPAQLDALQRARPAYALVSGAGGQRWDVVDAWCETRHLPCVMPVVDQVRTRWRDATAGDAAGAGAAGSRYWSVHLSTGTAGEAALIAQKLRSTPAGQVLQVHDGAAGTAGAGAALALQDRLATGADQAGLPAAAAGPRVTQRAWPSPGTRPARGQADIVVLWLTAARASRWLAQEAPAPGVTVLLSAQLAPPEAVQVPARWRGQVLWSSLRADPVRQQAGAALSLVPWAASMGLQVQGTAGELADVHAAAYFFGDAVALTRGALDPNHLLERLEVAVDRRPAGAAYFRLSLGPGQRIAAQGGHFLGFRAAGDRVPLPVSPYMRVDDR